MLLAYLFAQTDVPEIQVILPTAPAVSKRRAEISGLGPLAGCFLALGSGLRLVGTASARR